jgi:class 3 adenylate cyclase
MEKDQLSRKLAVILHADVVGSTALVQKDETIAHKRIQDTFQRFSETIINHGGIAHEIRGDALVAEFAKASDAVSASLAFQVANATHNEQLSDDIRPVLRIGISMGEVVVADNTLTGEGVVLAQRLEQLAEQGGICIQGAAYETLPKRLPFEYRSLGDQRVKGFAEPVRVFAVQLKPGEQIPDLESRVVVSEFGASGDQGLFVIARNSSFAYKNRSVDIRQIAHELGVRYVLEGSVRKGGNRVRISCQLIDASNGSHIWADRFDGTLEDVFDLQDQVTINVVGTIEPKLKAAEIERSRRKRPENLQAYDLLLQALPHLYAFRPETNAMAVQLLEQAAHIETQWPFSYSNRLPISILTMPRYLQISPGV